MSVTEVYERAISPLPPAERLQLVRLILDRIAPESLVDFRTEWSEDDLRDFSRASWEYINRSMKPSPR